MYDTLIKNGKIVSGLGNPWYRADVAVIEGRIVKIGQLGKERAAKIIDAADAVVAPGFIGGARGNRTALQLIRS